MRVNNVKKGVTFFEESFTLRKVKSKNFATFKIRLNYFRLIQVRLVLGLIIFSQDKKRIKTKIFENKKRNRRKFSTCSVFFIKKRNSKRYSRGESLTREDKMEDSWREYFEQLLNGGGRGGRSGETSFPNLSGSFSGGKNSRTYKSGKKKSEGNRSV